MTEQATLIGPQLKLGRAGEHLEDLELLIEDFIHTERQKVAVEDDSKTGYRLWVIAEPSQPDPRWNPIIGDVLYNLRSALDHLAWQLVIANGEKPTRGTSMPLFSDGQRFVESGLPALAGMSEQVKAAIEAAQPFHRPSPTYQTDALALLNRLNNEYKHRHFKLTLLSSEGGGGFSLPTNFEVNPGPIEGSTPIAAWKISDPDLQVDYTPFFDVVFADAAWADRRVIEILRRLDGAVRGLIVSLARVGGLAE